MSDAFVQPPTKLEAVIAANTAQNMDLAKRLAGDALSSGLEHPLLLNLRALAYEEAENFEAALADLRRAHFLAPRDYAILNACGLCLARMERPEEAQQCYEQALAIQPDFGPGWFNLGHAWDRLGEKAKAAEAYARAAAINPENVQAWSNLANLAARRGDAAGASDFADRALALYPGFPPALLALAESELAEPAKAEARLCGLLAGTLGDYDHAVALSLLADALHSLGRAAEAFGAYVEANRRFRDEARPRFEAPGQPTVADSVAWLIAWARGLDGGRWRTCADRAVPRDDIRGHVFLMGFPRSGTTLMETVLANHPDVVSLEERSTLTASIIEFMTDRDSLNRLGALPDVALQSFRSDYWARVKQYGVDVAGKVFIDKNPFNVVRLPLIYKLFPDARIIFAVRDPRDVVLSCFRRRFNVNPSTYELLDLGRAAAFYDGNMRLAEILRTKQPMAEHRLVYERLVSDFEAESKAACAFIGVDWRAELIDVAGRATRGGVSSASSAQIARGLYADGAGQWRMYREQLAPILPVLKPWVEHFGYPTD